MPLFLLDLSIRHGNLFINNFLYIFLNLLIYSFFIDKKNQSALLRKTIIRILDVVSNIRYDRS